AAQHGTLSRLLEGNLTFRLAAHDLRQHIQYVALELMTRWYQHHKQYKGRRLKVITLTRDPVTHYPSGFVRRHDDARADIIAWHRARLALRPGDAVDET